MNAPESVPAAIAEAPPSPSQFVRWLRDVAPYIHRFRGREIVIAFPGELVQAGRLASLVQDISLLQAMGMRIVVVFGSRPQINEQLRLRGMEPVYHGGVRITDQAALECAKEASGEIRLDLEAAFSLGLPNTPMAHSAMRVVSGNFVMGRPVGIVDGIDYQHTGLVGRIDVGAIRNAMNLGAVVLLSNLGFSATGEAFNLTMEDVASATAHALDADKLIYVTELPGIVGGDGHVIGELSEEQARKLLGSGSLGPDASSYLASALQAVDGGVARAHIVPFGVDGSLLLELFQHDGVGTMLVEETLEELREATLDDVGGIVTLIRPLERDGTLVPRDRARIENEIQAFSVIEHDGVIFGCAALYTFSNDKLGEMACLAVDPRSTGQGDGERLLKHIEQRARAAGLTRLFVLTTRTMHWFLKRGFVHASVDSLPEARRRLYDTQRKSQVLIKDL